MYKILLTDDESLEREGLKIIIKEILKDQVAFEEARLGREAISICDVFKPHIIFMDIRMPGMNGIEASEFIKKKHKDTIIIILSAYDDFELAQQAIRVGVDDYILKPARPTDIESTLKKHISKLENPSESIALESSLINKFTSNQTPDSSALQIVADYINSNLNSNITLEDGAKLLSVTPTYFSKLFKKEFGLTFITYITNKKIEIAKSWLEHTDMPILNISLELGFKEANYFCRIFKKSVGITPMEYRKQKR